MNDYDLILMSSIEIMIMINNVTERKRKVGRETERQTPKESRGEKEREREGES